MPKATKEIQITRFQKNNLTARYSKTIGVWRVSSPDGRELEEFTEAFDAALWMGTVKDWTVKHQNRVFADMV